MKKKGRKDGGVGGIIWPEFKFPLTQKQLEYVKPSRNQHLKIHIHIACFKPFCTRFMCHIEKHGEYQQQSQETISSPSF